MANETHEQPVANDPSPAQGIAGFSDRADMIVGVAAVLAAALRARRPESDVNSILRVKQLATWLVVAAHASGGDAGAEGILAGPVGTLRAMAPPRNFAGELLGELIAVAGGAPPECGLADAAFDDLFAHEPEDVRVARVMATLREITVAGGKAEIIK